MSYVIDQHDNVYFVGEKSACESIANEFNAAVDAANAKFGANDARTDDRTFCVVEDCE